MPINFILSFCSSLESEICYVENQSDIDKHKTTMVLSIQEFNREGKTISFIYKLKQNSLWTEYFCDENQTYTIKNHSDFLVRGNVHAIVYVHGHMLSGLIIFRQTITSKRVR